MHVGMTAFFRRWLHDSFVRKLGGIQNMLALSLYQARGEREKEREGVNELFSPLGRARSQKHHSLLTEHKLDVNAVATRNAQSSYTDTSRTSHKA